MKKYLMFFVSAILCLSLLSGCGSENATSQKSTAIETKQAAAETPAVKETTSTPKPTAAPKATPKATATPTPTPTPTPEVTEEPTGDTGFYSPLSGLPTSTDVSRKRPYIVMCDNSYLAVPHAGVSKSDMIIEMMEEGGITRMMAFYMDPSGIPQLGPVRSARAYNVYTALGYQGFLVHAGGSKEADGLVAQYGLEDIDGILGTFGNLFYRDQARVPNGAVHAFMISGDNAVNAAVNIGHYSLDQKEDYDVTYGLLFSDTAEEQCTEEASGEIVVTYNGGKTSRFYYDAENEQYNFYEFGDPYVDEEGSPVPMKNVIMIYANTFLQEDGLHLTIELTSGEGFFFTKGKVAHIQWYKDGPYDVFHYTLDDGTPLQLTPGRTFVAVNQTGGQGYQGSVSYN